MFSKSFLVSAILLAVSLQAHAQAGVSPALGVQGNNLNRSQVQRPSSNSRCGNINISNDLDSATPVNANSDGTFTVSATSFSKGNDGSRSFNVKVDSTGDGNNFVDGSIVSNGDSSPSSDGSQNIIAKLPSGTECTGGRNKDLCIAAFQNSAGFGNCVAVRQSSSSSSSSLYTNNNSNSNGGGDNDDNKDKNESSSQNMSNDRDRNNNSNDRDRNMSNQSSESKKNYNNHDSHSGMMGGSAKSHRGGSTTITIIHDHGESRTITASSSRMTDNNRNGNMGEGSDGMNRNGNMGEGSNGMNRNGNSMQGNNNNSNDNMQGSSSNSNSNSNNSNNGSNNSNNSNSNNMQGSSSNNSNNSNSNSNSNNSDSSSSSSSSSNNNNNSNNNASSSSSSSSSSATSTASSSQPSSSSFYGSSNPDERKANQIAAAKAMADSFYKGKSYRRRAGTTAARAALHEAREVVVERGLLAWLWA
jgi:hypothetical protein